MSAEVESLLVAVGAARHGRLCRGQVSPKDFCKRCDVLYAAGLSNYEPEVTYGPIWKV